MPWSDMRGGNVPLAFVRGTNPAYYLPASLHFAEAFAKVPFKVAFATQPDETVELCDLVLPDLHSLESWGDAQPVKGTLGLQQPTMDPVFTGTRGAGDVMLVLAQKDPTVAARFPQKDYRVVAHGAFRRGPRGLRGGIAQGHLGGHDARARDARRNRGGQRSRARFRVGRLLSDHVPASATR